MRIVMFRFPLLLSALVLVLPVGAAVAQEPERTWEFQLSGYGGLAGLVSRGDVDLVDFRDESVVMTGREASWGAGLRAMRGRWGFDARYQRLDAGLATPTALMREAGWLRPDHFAVPDAPSNLLSALVVVEIPYRDSDLAYFLGVGAGYLLFGGSGSDRTQFSGAPPWIYGPDDLPPAYEPGPNTGDPIGLEGSSVEADRGAILVGGSLGATLRWGRFLVRPRMDLLVGRSRTVRETWDVVYDFPAYSDPVVRPETVVTRSRPVLVLFSLEAGWSSGR